MSDVKGGKPPFFPAQEAGASGAPAEVAEGVAAMTVTPAEDGEAAAEEEAPPQAAPKVR